MTQEHTNPLEPLHGKLISMIWKPGFMAIRTYRVPERYLGSSIHSILSAVLVSEKPYHYACNGASYELTECVLLDSGLFVQHAEYHGIAPRKPTQCMVLCLKTLHPTDGVRLYELTFRTTTPDWDLIEITKPEESTPPS